MIANFFNNAKPINVVLLLALLILFFLLALFQLPVASFSLNTWLLKTTNLLLLLMLLFIYNFIVNRNRLTYVNHYSILFFCLLFGLFNPMLISTKFLIAQIILALAFRRIYSLRINRNVQEKLFDSALFIALASFLFQDSAIFILLIYTVLLVFQRNNWNYFIIPIIGFLMPYALVYVYSLAFGDFEFFNQIWQIRTSLNFEVLTHNTMAVYLAIIIGIGLMSFILNTLRTVQFSNEFRGLWSLVFVHFILATCLLFSGRDFETLNTAYIIFPLSIILANHLQNMTIKWRKEVFIYIFIGLTFSKIAYNLLP